MSLILIRGVGLLEFRILLLFVVNDSFEPLCLFDVDFKDGAEG
jgi:hypothetical protein